MDGSVVSGLQENRRCYCQQCIVSFSRTIYIFLKRKKDYQQSILSLLKSSFNGISTILFYFFLCILMLCITILFGPEGIFECYIPITGYQYFRQMCSHSVLVTLLLYYCMCVFVTVHRPGEHSEIA